MTKVSQRTAGKIAKGLYAGSLAFAASLAAVLVGNEAVSNVTSGQWVVICGSALAGFGGAFGLADWSGPKVNGIGAPPPESG